MSRVWRSDDTDPWLDAFGDGSAGDWTIASSVTHTNSTHYNRSSIAGTSGGYTATAGQTVHQNGELVLLIQCRGTGAGNYELNRIASGGGTTSLTFAYPLQNTYTEDGGASQAQIIQLKPYNNITVNSGQTLTAELWDGNIGGVIVLIAAGTITVTGTISASGRGFAGGALVTGDTVGKQGDGSAGAGTNSQAANGCGGGGGQRHNPGVYNPSGGGGGGHAAAGSNPTNKTNSGSGTVGGSAVGVAGLTTIFMGGGGGAGGGKSGGGNSGAGGTGGGIIILIAKTITIGGTVVANGANGSAPSNTSDAGGDGGGGGAGGSVLLKGEDVTVGTNKITVAAGAGNTSGSHSNAGNGAVGRIHVDYSNSFSGSASPTIDSRLDTTIVGRVPTTNYLRRYRRTRIPGGINGV
jgi:hypothetical protein